MFDIKCPHCGEPWDNDCLHDVAEYGGPENLSYKSASKAFAKVGCGLFNKIESEPFILGTTYRLKPCANQPCESPIELARVQAAMILSDHPDEWSI